MVDEGTTVDYVISDGPEPKATTYTASVSSTVTYSGGDLDGQSVTIIVLFNGEEINRVQFNSLTAGASIQVSGSKTGLSQASGSASLKILNAGNDDVTGSFGGTTPTATYTAE